MDFPYDEDTWVWIYFGHWDDPPLLARIVGTYEEEGGHLFYELVLSGKETVLLKIDEVSMIQVATEENKAKEQKPRILNVVSLSSKKLLKEE